MEKMERSYVLLFLLLLLTPQMYAQSSEMNNAKLKGKHWIWINPGAEDHPDTLSLRYKKYKESGIVGIFFEQDSEKHYRIAKKAGLEAHRWMWIMNRADALKNNPEWAAVSRNGDGCAVAPPYVDYYKWMCPSRPEVIKHISDDVKQQLSKDYVDGIHMDYVRYCDVVLPVNLWQGYGIEQTSEHPEYDFCYCEVCKKKFEEEYGIKVDEIKYPQESLSWRNFRYNAVSSVVTQVVRDAGDAGKPVTAAVFPTPDVAKRIVRQDWTNWNLTAVYPMIYHGFYKEPVRWIGDAVAQGVRGIDGRFPLYAGLFLPDFKDCNEFEEGVRFALSNGARGISVFGDPDDKYLNVLSRYKE
ncbi:MAG: family 10 glycosylhydrolase [Bacteroidales bacterium]